MLRKFFKYLLGLAAAGTVIGVLYAYFSGKQCTDFEDQDSGLSEEEDFDLDSDLEPVTQREYVPLNHTKTSDDTEKDSQES